MDVLDSEAEDVQQVIKCAAERWPNRFFWATGAGAHRFSLLFFCRLVGYNPEPDSRSQASADADDLTMEWYESHGSAQENLSSGMTLPSVAELQSCHEWDVTDEPDSLAAHWRRVLEYYDGNNFSPPTGALHWPMTLRLLAKQRIPHHVRGRVWLTMSGARGVQRDAEKQGPAHQYGPMLWSRCSEQTRYAISLDVGRTFCGDDDKAIAFRKVSSQHGLARVLQAFGARNTEVGYCQGMSFVASTLLLVMDEASAFYTLSWLVEDFLPDDYYTTLKSVLCDTRVLDILLQRTNEPLMRHLIYDCQLPEVSMFSIQWFMCLFSRSLPLRNVLQIWDQVFVCSHSEGPSFSRHEILFRVAIGIFSHLEEALLKADSPTEVQSLITTVELTEEEIAEYLFASLGPLEPLRDSERVDKGTTNGEVSDYTTPGVASAGKRRFVQNRLECCPRVIQSDLSDCCAPSWLKMKALFSGNGPRRPRYEAQT
eukprot:GEMP01056140.1.p1 GENE.GEMP01056140.1~~GEMP01056140.1.p1  ORF type:complete len:482 (+),score=97.67 GEMP01056140.1:13-1458(+)